MIEPQAPREESTPRLPQEKSHKEEAESALGPRLTWRFGAIAVIFSAATLLILLRLVSYQLFPTRALEPVYAAPAEPARGTIVDRHGNVLGIDRFFYDVSATPKNLTAEERREVAAKLGELIGIDPQAALVTLEANKEGAYSLLAKDLTLAEALPLMNYLDTLDESEDGTGGDEYSPFEQVYITPAPERYYPEGDLIAHVTGFVGINTLTDSGRVGHYGLESYYDAFLSQGGVGLLGQANGTLDDLPRTTRRYLPSPQRRDLVLTLDRTMQWIAEEELDYALRYFRAQRGSIIAMDPRTGEILALANAPTFDPNQYAEAKTDHFSNPTVNLQYEPGSIFKVITVAAALDTGVVTPTMIFTDTGSITVGGRIFFNSNRGQYGRITLADALARSLNVVTVQVAEKLGAEEFYHYVRRFGFGQPSGVDLAGEVNGLLKSPGDPNWSQSDLAANSFGQGLAVTPLQMLSAVATLANEGRYMRPYLVDARVAGDDVLFTQPTVARQVISPETAATMRELMQFAVDTGIRAARIPGYAVAGKTGTAQIPTEEGYTEEETITTFVGFVPADDPQLVVLVKLDRPDPAISPWAAYTAAPTFARVTKRYIDYLNIPPDEIRLGVGGEADSLENLVTEAE
jgi:cell division protein FtsI/penicillin-binding protein 2